MKLKNNKTPNSEAIVAKASALPLVLCPGEPAGIGYDVSLMAAASGHLHHCIVLADVDVMAQRAEMLGLNSWQQQAQWRHRPLGATVKAGQVSSAYAKALLEQLAEGVDMVRSGQAHALVTGALNKASIARGGYPEFRGHTEWLAARAGIEHPVMMLCAGDLRVALASTHIALAEVAPSLSQALLERVFTTVAEALVGWFGIQQPRIAVCGLNPHAGEEGLLGDEEQRLITPAIKACANARWQLSGPLPADTLFIPEQRQRWDAVVGMYHDQVLPTIKALAFDHTVNLTLGLPFIRTSVDHGTALSLAGSGQANPCSLIAACDLARELTRNAE